MPRAPSGLHVAFSATNTPRCGGVSLVVGCCAGGCCTGGGFGCVVFVVGVVVVVDDDVVLTEMSATSGVGTMLTDWVVLVFGEPPDEGDEIGLESKLHPAMPSTISRAALAKAGIHRAFLVNTGAP